MNEFPQYYKETEERLKNSDDILNLAFDYQNKGKLYMHTDSVKALEYLEKALKINIDTIQIDVNIAMLQSLISTVYSLLGRDEKAWGKALITKDMYETIYKKEGIPLELKNHYYHNLAHGYYKLGRYSKNTNNSTKYYKISLETLKKVSLEYKNIGETYQYIAKCHIALETNYSLTLDFLIKALKQKNSNKRIVIDILMDISLIYHIKDDNITSLEYTKQTIKLGEEILLQNDFLLANLYYQATLLYMYSQKFDDAYDYAKKGFDSRKNFRVNNFQILDNEDKYNSLNNINYNGFIDLILLSVGYYIMNSASNNQKINYLLKKTFNDVINYKGEISNFNNIISIIEVLQNK